MATQGPPRTIWPTRSSTALVGSSCYCIFLRYDDIHGVCPHQPERGSVNLESRPDFLGSYDHEDNRGTSTSSTDSDNVHHNGYRAISFVSCLTLPGALTVPNQLAFHPPAWHLPKTALGWSAVVGVVVRASPTRGTARLTDEACGTFGQVLETYAFQHLTGATVVIIGYCSVSLHYPLCGSLTAYPDCHQCTGPVDSLWE